MICSSSIGFGPGFDSSVCTDPRPPAPDLAAIEDEAVSLLQSFLHAPGGYPDPTDPGIPQPGTLGFDSAVCTRFVGGQVIVLPGCRGPGDPGYDPGVDGMLGGLLHPFTGQAFRNEIAALSWNLLMFLVLTSREEGATGPDLFDEEMSLRSDGCSYVRPTLCSNVQAFAAVPEPGARLLALLGLVGLAAAGQRRLPRTRLEGR
jgi:hypothetical protein